MDINQRGPDYYFAVQVATRMAIQTTKYCLGTVNEQYIRREEYTFPQSKKHGFHLALEFIDITKGVCTLSNKYGFG